MRIADFVAPDTRFRVALLYTFLIGFNLAVWAWAFIAFREYPLLIGTAFLAYGFGLRHAVDADHIAAIDNVTRKLMQDGKRPVTVGFYFSLGHSTVVILASVAIAVTAAALETRFSAYREIGGFIGTGVSTLFLFAIAIVNLMVLGVVYRAFRRVRRGERYVEEDMQAFLAQRGLLGRLFRPLFKLVTRSWHLYPLGFLFGLGFDTATEIALLDISAVEAAKGLSLWSILIFPALFTAGMALIDTSDGVLMLGAYGWAYAKPIRKLYYNVSITFVSAVVALLVGGIEALGLIGDQLGRGGPFWDFIAGLNDHFGSIGYVIIAIFIVSWLGSMAIYRWKRYDEIEMIGG